MTRFKNVIIGVLAVAAILCLSLLIWQAVSFNEYKDNHPNDSNLLPQTYQWLGADVKGLMNTKADPCNDFYEYVCGGFEVNTVLDPDEGIRYRSFYDIDVSNAVILNGIVDGQWPLIADFMDSCMLNASTVAQDTHDTFMTKVSQIIDPISTVDINDLLPVLGELHLLGVDAIWVPSVLDDIFKANSDNYILLEMSGTTYYASSYRDPRFDLNQLVSFIQTVMSVVSVPISTVRATAVANLEVALALIQPDILVIEDYFRAMSSSDFNSLSGMNFTLYAATLGVTEQAASTVLVNVPSFFGNLTSVLSRTSVGALKDYLHYRFALAEANNIDVLLPESLRSPHFSEIKKNTILNAQNIQKERFSLPSRQKKEKFIDLDAIKRKLLGDNISARKANCITLTLDVLDDFIGLLFSTIIVDQTERNLIVEMTQGIEDAFQANLPSLSWLSAQARQNVIKKLNSIIQIVGHPNKLDRYRGLLLDPDHLLSNVFLLTKRRSLDNFRAVGMPFNRSDYEFPATIVNAFYSPITNTINFPAGILESPMFSKSFPKMLNYARMGYVVGHEMTHGFDNNGRMWNGDGVYQDIMDESSGQNFNQKAYCIASQYNLFSPIPGLFVNGYQTLGENIADLGGVKNSFRAYKNWVSQNGQEFKDNQVIDGLTNDQLFFVMLGQTWCSKATDDAIRQQVASDVHSPAKFRVNGPLSNFDEFKNAFKCSPSSAMVHSPSCDLW